MAHYFGCHGDDVADDTAGPPPLLLQRSLTNVLWPLLRQTHAALVNSTQQIVGYGSECEVEFVDGESLRGKAFDSDVTFHFAVKLFASSMIMVKRDDISRVFTKVGPIGFDFQLIDEQWLAVFVDATAG